MLFMQDIVDYLETDLVKPVNKDYKLPEISSNQIDGL